MASPKQRITLMSNYNTYHVYFMKSHSLPNTMCHEPKPIVKRKPYLGVMLGSYGKICWTSDTTRDACVLAKVSFH
jgi:hypothetical protein